MILKYIFDRIVALIGLLVLWPVLLIVAILIKVKMPGGPVFFVQKRVGKGGKLFDCHKFRTMRVNANANLNANLNLLETYGTSEQARANGNGNVNPNLNANLNLDGNGNGNGNVNGNGGWSTVSVAGDGRITPLGATLRHYKLDELPGLWDVLIGNMSFVGPRPDVPGYADQLQGDDRDVLKLRPGITGPATLKYRREDEFLADARSLVYCLPFTIYGITKEQFDEMTDQEVAEWYNDNVIYPDKVRLNCYYYRHYSFVKDIQMILCTVLGKKMEYAGEVI